MRQITPFGDRLAASASEWFSVIGRIGLDVKPPSGLQQIAALNQLFEISSRNAAGFQVTRAQHSQLARELQHLFLMVFGHGVNYYIMYADSNK